MPDTILISPENKGDIVRGTDSVTLIATEMYEAGAYQRFLHGDKYRDAWASSITVPILWLDALNGGLRPTEKGGGYQTLSLDLVDSSNYVYTIRSVTKNPVKLIKPWMKFLGLDNMVIDGIAAGHPYGAMVIPALSESAGVPHFFPKLYFVPSQENLDSFNQEFGNKLFWIEIEPEEKVPLKFNISNAEDFDDSEKVLEKWHEDPENNIPDLSALVRARIFDLWVGDWDRHDGQWGWIQYQDGDVNRYRPVPNDRDNVFYKIDGLYPSIVRSFEKRFQPFRSKIKSMEGLTANSAYFDYSFLYDVELEVFIKEAKFLQAALTDEKIKSAIKVWPEEIYALDGERIVSDLIARRGDLQAYASDFFKVIQDRGEVLDHPR